MKIEDEKRVVMVAERTPETDRYSDDLVKTIDRHSSVVGAANTLTGIVRVYAALCVRFGVSTEDAVEKLEKYYKICREVDGS